MSEFYNDMYNTAKDLLTEYGTSMILGEGDGQTLGIIAFAKPDRKRDDMPLERTYITKSNQRRAYFQLTNGEYEPEMGHRITSGGQVMTIQSVRPIAPANQTVVYECLLEV